MSKQYVLRNPIEIKEVGDDWFMSDLVYMDDNPGYVSFNGQLLKDQFVEASELEPSEPLSVVQRTQIREQLNELANDCYVIGWANGKGEPGGQNTQDCIDRALSAIGLILGDKDGS